MRRVLGSILTSLLMAGAMLVGFTQPVAAVGPTWTMDTHAYSPAARNGYVTTEVSADGSTGAAVWGKTGDTGWAIAVADLSATPVDYGTAVDVPIPAVFAGRATPVASQPTVALSADGSKIAVSIDGYTTGWDTYSFVFGGTISGSTITWGTPAQTGMAPIDDRYTALDIQLNAAGTAGFVGVFSYGDSATVSQFSLDASGNVSVGTVTPLTGASFTNGQWVNADMSTDGTTGMLMWNTPSGEIAGAVSKNVLGAGEWTLIPALAISSPYSTSTQNTIRMGGWADLSGDGSKAVVTTVLNGPSSTKPLLLAAVDLSGTPTWGTPAVYLASNTGVTQEASIRTNHDGSVYAASSTNNSTVMPLQGGVATGTITGTTMAVNEYAVPLGSTGLSGTQAPMLAINATGDTAMLTTLGLDGSNAATGSYFAQLSVDLSDGTGSFTGPLTLMGAGNPGGAVLPAISQSGADVMGFWPAQPSIATGNRAATAPSAPLNVTATAGQENASLTWAPPISDGGSPINDYRIQRSTDGGSTWSSFAATGSDATSATVNGLTGGQAYLFRVAAENSVGPGPYSGNSNSITPTAGPTPPPDNPLGPDNTGLPAGGVPAGEVMAFVDGVPQSITVQPNAAATGIVVRGPGFTERIAGYGGANNPEGLTPQEAVKIVSETAERSVSVRASQPTAEVSGTGYKPNSNVDLYILELDNLYLGTVVTNSAGNFKGRVPIPAGIKPGVYTLQANGYTPDSKVRSLSIGVQVVSSSRPTVTALKVSGSKKKLKVKLAGTSPQKRGTALIYRAAKKGAKAKLVAQAPVKRFKWRQAAVSMAGAKSAVFCVRAGGKLSAAIKVTSNSGRSAPSASTRGDLVWTTRCR